MGDTANYLTTAPLINFVYASRFSRLFEEDAGFQMAFGAANNQNAEVTGIRAVQGGDHEFMIPLVGRVYMQQPFKRFEVSVGGGTAYLQYSETVSQGNTGYSIGCYSCASRCAERIGCTSLPRCYGCEYQRSGIPGSLDQG